LFVLLNAYITGQALSVVYTLVSPILSDQFGFTVYNTALFFVGLGVGGFASVLIQLCAKALRCNNRVMVGLVFVMIVIGCSLVTDWQAIHVQDPCRRPSLMNNVTSDAGEASNVSFIDGNTNESNVTQFQLLVEKCEARSTSGYECFWNPHSRVTGDQCNTCYEGCLSLQTYLNFYQYTVGVFLVSVGGTLEYIYNFALLSDIIPPENQGSITAFTIGCGALSRTVTPLWYVESYEQTGKHTFLPLIITMVTFLIALVVLAVLYKDLAPRNTRTEPQHATNPSAQELKPVTKIKM
jgi:MFS family permease